MAKKKEKKQVSSEPAVGRALLLAPLGLLAVIAALVLGLSKQNAQSIPAFLEMEKWVEKNGGRVDAFVGFNKQGIRSLFAKRSFYPGDVMFSIPDACAVDLGAHDGRRFTNHTLAFMREFHNPASRYRPYFNTLPPPHEVASSFSLREEHLPLLQAEAWISFVKMRQSMLRSFAEQHVFTEEAAQAWGRTLALEDVAYAEGVSSTRYVAENDRIQLVPFYDMANHYDGCPHHLEYEPSRRMLHFVAGSYVKRGAEICNEYRKYLRDDMAVMMYGFLPDAKDPPRLLQVDHHLFSAENPFANVNKMTDKRFKGSYGELKAELERQRSTLEELEKHDRSKAGSQPGGKDGVRDMLLALQKRRRQALRYEVKRLSNLLAQWKVKENGKE